MALSVAPSSSAATPPSNSRTASTLGLKGLRVYQRAPATQNAAINTTATARIMMRREMCHVRRRPASASTTATGEGYRSLGRTASERVITAAQRGGITVDFRRSGASPRTFLAAMASGDSVAYGV